MKPSFIVFSLVILFLNGGYLFIAEIQGHDQPEFNHDFDNKITIQGWIDDPLNRNFVILVVTGIGSEDILTSVSAITEEFELNIPVNQSLAGQYVLWIMATDNLNNGLDCHCLSLSIRIADSPGLHVLFFPFT